jgi:hypothetical protein
VNIWLDRYIEAPQTHWNFVAMSLLSYVDWCEFRKLRNFDGHDKLKQFAKNFGEMTGAAETKPR